MRYGAALVVGVGLMVLSGCSRKSSLLLERQARGPLQVEPTVAMPGIWHLEPQEQTKVQGDIEIHVRHASHDYLRTLFSNKQLFGAEANVKNVPFYPENMVFYIRIANKSQQKIGINPPEFAMVDDRGNQYATVGVDYVTALSEMHSPVATATRGVLSSASPGYFGFSLPLGKMLAGKPHSKFTLLQQSSIQPGYQFPDVTYDGLIAFWTPSTDAKKLKLIIANVKTNFDANDFPQTALDFPFEFAASFTPEQTGKKKKKR
jgi:hypothetical protein